MENKFVRPDERKNNELRNIKVTYDTLGYAQASVLLELGKTKVLASITLQYGVPQFLRGQQTGWLTAEYAMLPCSTHKRINRESSQQKRNSRSVEISRLIGRSFRSVVDLDAIKEKTIIIDCDVLQADGGTRVACITAANLALNLAAKRWVEAKITPHNIVKEEIAALSAGLINDNVCLDLSYEEDSVADADFNFVLTKSGKLIEIQGTAEKSPLNWNTFETFKDLVSNGIKQLFEACAQVTPAVITSTTIPHVASKQGAPFIKKQTKKPLFNLGKRLGNK